MEHPRIVHKAAQRGCERSVAQQDALLQVNLSSRAVMTVAGALRVSTNYPKGPPSQLFRNSLLATNNSSPLAACLASNPQ